MDERLRLLAELKDNMSAGLAKINKELKQTKRTPGMEQAQKWFDGFNATTKETVKAGGQVSSILGAVGVGGLTAATSLAVLSRQLKELGDHAFTMKRLGQETRMTIDQVSRWEYVGQVFRVPVEQMDAALKEFGDKMVDFRRRRGELFGQLNQIAPEEATKLLGLKDGDAQVKEVLQWLSTIKDAALRNRWTKEFFGTDDLDALLAKGMPALQKAIADAGKNVPKIPKEFQDASDQLNTSVTKLNAAWTAFEYSVGPGLLNTLRHITDMAANLLHGLGPGFTDKEKAELDKKDEERRKAVQKSFGLDKPLPADPPPDQSITDNKSGIWSWLGHKSAYAGASSKLLHFAAFGSESAPGAGASSFGIEATIASGTKIGVLAAFREWAAEGDAQKDAAGPGFQQASFETGNPRGGGRGDSGGGGSDGGRDGESGSGNPDVTPDADVIKRFTKEGVAEGFNTRGVRNMNPGNIGFGKWAKEHGAIGSAGSDTGHGVAVFPNFEAGYKAMNDLALSKYGSGMRSMNQLIAGAHGWTPGNASAAANVARYMGIGPNDDAHLDDPAMLSKFRAGLSVQELGPAGARYAFNQIGRGFAAGSGGNPVDIAKGMLGFGEGAAAKALGHYMHSGEWCADFVNGSLAKAGSSGTKSAMAASFFQWGRHVDPGGAQKGDVMVSGHHVGFAEGPAQMHNGRMMMPMISGNHGHKVGESWEPVGKYEVRRAVGSLVEEARKSRERNDQAAGDGSIEAHVHIHDGQVRGATAKSSGSVKPPRVHLRRGPTMTEPSISA